MLIRNTLEPQSFEVHEKPTRRITLTFDKEKLEKLDEIAKGKQTYLRKIIDEIVNDFLSNYDKEVK